MNNEQQCREAFEQWAEPRGWNVERNGCSYRNADTNNCWIAWSAAQAAQTDPAWNAWLKKAQEKSE